MARERLSGSRSSQRKMRKDVGITNGMEDPDEFFNSNVTSPGKENSSAKTTRFSVGSTGSSSTFRTQDQEKAKQMKKRFNSPSDVSRVSTAPASDKKIETARMAAKETEAALEQADADDNGFLMPEDPVEASFEEDADDLMPPPPPDSPAGMEEPTQNETDFPAQMDDDMDNDDGVGFEMADNEEEEVQEEVKVEKKKKKTKKVTMAASDTDDDLEPPVKRKKAKKKKTIKRTAFSPKGMQAGPTEFDEYSVAGLTDSPESAAAGLRRSRRARIKPLAYWKNERPILGPNDFDDDLAQHGLMTMPEVKGYYKAQPTPYKKRKPLPARVVSDSKSSKKPKVDLGDVNGYVPSAKPFDARKLRKKYDYLDGEEANLWDEVFERNDPETKVVAYRENMVERDLPASKNRPKSDGKEVGRAAQAFNIMNDDADFLPGYIMGHLMLPPKAIKDPESVGPCAQTFTVCACQPGALEVAYSLPEEDTGEMNPTTAQRFLLKPMDLFRIPPGNCYRLQNHSKTTDAVLTWTIIRPASVQDPTIASRSTNG